MAKRLLDQEPIASIGPVSIAEGISLLFRSMTNMYIYLYSSKDIMWGRFKRLLSRLLFHSSDLFLSLHLLTPIDSDSTLKIGIGVF